MGSKISVTYQQYESLLASYQQPQEQYDHMMLTMATMEEDRPSAAEYPDGGMSR